MAISFRFPMTSQSAALMRKMGAEKAAAVAAGTWTPQRESRLLRLLRAGFIGFVVGTMGAGIVSLLPRIYRIGIRVIVVGGAAAQLGRGGLPSAATAGFVLATFAPGIRGLWRKGQRWYDTSPWILRRGIRRGGDIGGFRRVPGSGGWR